MTNEEMSAKTKAHLAKVLKEKMIKKPLSKITVSELAEAAEVNRKTFYYYFEDIYSLLKWMLDEEAIGVVKQMEDKMDYIQAIHFVMDYIEQNDHILNCATDSLGIEGLKRFFYQDALGITRTALNEAEKEYGIQLEAGYKQFLTVFLTDAISGILLGWARNMRPVDRSRIIGYLSRTFRALVIQENTACNPVFKE